MNFPDPANLSEAAPKMYAALKAFLAVVDLSTDQGKRVWYREACLAQEAVDEAEKRNPYPTPARAGA
jgi:hypothetical protein